jgi:hypothetical protein
MPAARLGLALFLVSFATVLFTLSVWKLLSFFIMPSLFFDLLFIGFPLGAFLGVKFFTVSPQSFLRSLWALQVVMGASVFACLLCKHFDYLRAHLFEVELARLVVQMGIFTALFIPFFCAYGLSEYVGYQLGRLVLAGRMRRVYAIYLFGAASAYCFTEVVLHQHLLGETFGRIGVSHLLALAIGLVALSTSILAGQGAARWIAAAESLAMAVAILSPGLEPGFLALYKGESPQSTKAYLETGEYEEVFQRWGHYSLTEVLEGRSGSLVGFYNDLMQWEFSRGTGFEARMLGAVPINLAHDVAPGGRVAIIGAGGGRQVRWALQPPFRFERIVAIELEPAVFEAARGDLAGKFDSVYEAETVVPLLAEARGYMEETEETFDLVFLPSVGGYPQMMLEPGNMIRTLDAYRVLRERLSGRGILAIWYPRGLDPKGVLTEQYVRTLGPQGLKLATRAYLTQGAPIEEYLILAAKDSSTRLPSARDIDVFLRGEAPGDPWRLPPVREALTRELFVDDDPGFKPISDDQPFLAGNVRHIFSLAQVYALLAVAGSVLLAITLLLFFALRRGGDPGIPGRSYRQVAGLSLLIGANFILLEHHVILALFRGLYVYHEALVAGAISFLILSGLGSVVISARLRGPLLLVACATLLAVSILETLSVRLPPPLLIASVAPVAFVTGSLFPALFELAARNPVAVFAMDAMGAAAGSLLSFFIPIAFGFSAFFPTAAAVFFLTSFATWRFYRGAEPAGEMAAANATTTSTTPSGSPSPRPPADR